MSGKDTREQKGAIQTSEELGDVQAALAFAERTLPAADFEPAPGVLLMQLQDGQRVESLKPFIDQFRENPERAIGTAKLADEAGFVAHVNRQKAAHSVVFACDDMNRPSLLAVYDYHGPQTAGRDGQPRHGGHRANYEIARTEEWLAWHFQEAKGYVSAAEFAEFVEDRIADVVSDPTQSPALLQLRELIGGEYASASKLMQLSRGIAINVNETLRSATSLSSGEISVVYEAKHSDPLGGTLLVPSLFAIGVPIFKNGDRYQIAVRLRYRTSGGKVTWAIDLYRADAAWDSAFAELIERVRVATELPVLLGSPEA